jgi:hypothetical protein
LSDGNRHQQQQRTEIVGTIPEPLQGRSGDHDVHCRKIHHERREKKKTPLDAVKAEAAAPGEKWRREQHDRHEDEKHVFPPDDHGTLQFRAMCRRVSLTSKKALL